MTLFENYKLKIENYSSLLAFLTVLAALFFTPLFTADAAVLRTPPNNLGLVGYWSMEDGSGSTATDFSGNGNAGTLTNMDPGSDWVSGRRGTALDFDGNNDYVDTGQNTGITGEITVSHWIRADDFRPGNSTHSVSSGYDGSNTGWECNWMAEDQVGDSSKDLICGSFDGSVNRAYVDGDKFNTNKWYHVVMSYTGSTWEIYINGEKETDKTEGDDTGAVNSSAKRFIGAHNNNGSAANYFEGTIDEVRIYNRALSASEIRDLYQSGYAKINRTAKVAEVGDPVGWWTFDGRDMDWSADTAQDRAGSNDGTLNGGMSNADSKPGRIGQALAFDGEDDSVDAPDTSMNFTNADPFTYMGWVKVNNYDEDGLVVGQRSGCCNWSILTVGASTGNPKFNTKGDSNSIGASSDDSLTKGTWYHLAGVHSSDTNKLYVNGELASSTTKDLPESDDLSGGNLYIGRAAAETDGFDDPLDGEVDDVRVYGQALSADEIQKIYNATRPSEMNASQDTELTDGLVGMWSFDGPSIDWSSNTASDVSENSNDGTITNMSTSSAPQPGVIGQALAFDGDNDYVDLSSPTFGLNNEVTVSLWQYGDVNDQPQEDAIIRGVDTNNDRQLNVHIPWSDEKVYWDAGNDGGEDYDRISKTAADSEYEGQWNHWVFTKNASTGYMYIYLNGEQWHSASSKTDSFKTVTDFDIGQDTDGTSRYSGKIDNVRIYDRALGENEVKRLYRLGR